MAEKVTVTISGGKITTSPLKLDLRGKGRNVQIHWRIETEGWTFTDDGIVFDDGSGQFFGKEHLGNQLKWKDRNDDHAEHKYTIHVTDGTTDLDEDPWIIND